MQASNYSDAEFWEINQTKSVRYLFPKTGSSKSSSVGFLLLHEPNPCSALSSSILHLCQIPHANNRAEPKPRIINTTQSFVSKAASPGWMEAETTAVGWQHPQQGPPPCQHPWGDEAMIAQGRQQCILTSPCSGLWHKILKFTSSLLSASSRVCCSHPGPGQGSRQFPQAAVSAPSPLPSSQ